VRTGQGEVALGRRSLVLFGDYMVEVKVLRWHA